MGVEVKKNNLCVSKNGYTPNISENVYIHHFPRSKLGNEDNGSAKPKDCW